VAVQVRETKRGEKGVGCNGFEEVWRLRVGVGDVWGLELPDEDDVWLCR
jgi:hypothetical protein